MAALFFVCANKMHPGIQHCPAPDNSTDRRLRCAGCPCKANLSSEWLNVFHSQLPIHSYSPP
jgi:hypothetical protein